MSVLSMRRGFSVNVDQVDVEFFWSKTHDGKIVATLNRRNRRRAESLRGENERGPRMRAVDRAPKDI